MLAAVIRAFSTWPIAPQHVSVPGQVKQGGKIVCRIACLCVESLEPIGLVQMDGIIAPRSAAGVNRFSWSIVFTVATELRRSICGVCKDYCDKISRRFF